MTTRTPARRAKTTRSRARAKGAAALLRVALGALEDMKAVNLKVIDVRGLTDVADTLVIASGTSDRHVRSLAEHVVAQAKANGVRPLGMEGEREGEWVLVDLQDIVVHVMLPRIREFYGLERMWGVEAPGTDAAAS
jgi:ribosome-associated protein